MTATNALELGRQAFDCNRWAEAHSELSTAALHSQLTGSDLFNFATAAELTGREQESTNLWAQAHHQFLAEEDVPRALRSAFHLIRGLAYRGDLSQAGGWLARTKGLLADLGDESVERGYLLLPVALMSLHAGDVAGAFSTFSQVLNMALHYGDPDLLALGRLGVGRGLVRMGEVEEGVALLDQAMVSVTAGEVSAIVSGIVYCATIDACREIFDLRRAREWTSALSYWCSSQPEMVPFRGECLIHRVEIMQLHGAWPDALEEAERACRLLAGQPGHPASPEAHLQKGDLLRLRGNLVEAEEEYRTVARLGQSPQPGLARLRLAKGQAASALKSIRLALPEAPGRFQRARMLEALVEVTLAVGEKVDARTASNALNELSGQLNAPLLTAMALHCEGAVLLAEGDATGAFAELRRAWRLWSDLDAPYFGAQTRTLLGLAARDLGDEDTARMELDAALWVFRQLGAALEAAQVERLISKTTSEESLGLTVREIEVLRLIAAGKTNRAIAGELFLSQKTVARHISNIFTKLDINSRSAATAFAFQHKLV